MRNLDFALLFRNLKQMIYSQSGLKPPPYTVEAIVFKQSYIVLMYIYLVKKNILIRYDTQFKTV